MLCTVVTFWKRHREVEEVKLTTLVCFDFDVLRNNLKILPVLQDMWQYHFLNVYSDKRSQIWFHIIFNMVNPTGIENLPGHKFNGLRRQLLLMKHLGGIILGIIPCQFLLLYLPEQKCTNGKKITLLWVVWDILSKVVF